MEIKTFISLLQHPESISRAQLTALSELTSLFPYFQSARCLHLKGLKDQDSFLYNQELKKTAAYTTDRSVLFDFITTLHRVENTTEPSASLQHNTLPSIPQHEIEVTDETILNTETPSDAKNTTTVEAIATTLDVNAPLNFDRNEVHSFSEWLQITSLRPIHRDTDAINQKEPEKEILKKDSPQKQQLRLIDKFISENPKIPPVSKNTKSRSIVTEDTSTPDELMTETLAKVYLAQKNYKKAIQAYKILILKNPEKSGFFADQIRSIQQLKDNK